MQVSPDRKLVARLRAVSSPDEWAGCVDAVIAALENADRDRFVAEATELLLSSLNLDETVQTVAALAVPTFADWAAVDRFDDMNQCRRVAVRHSDPAKVELAHEIFRRYPPPAIEVAEFRRAGRSLLFDVTDDMLVRAARDAEHLRISRALQLSSWISVPLRERSGRVTGSLTFVRTGVRRRYDQRDLEVAERLARCASVAIENAELYSEVHEARTRLEHASRRFERIALVSPDLLYVVAVPDGSVVYLNRAEYSKLPLAPGELLHPDDHAGWVDGIARATALTDAELTTSSYRLRGVDGEWRWFEARLVVVARDAHGAASEILGVARDASESRRQAAALAASEERHRLATEAVRGLVYEWDLSGGQVVYSRGVRDIIGFVPDTPKEVSWWRDRVHPEDLPFLDQAFASAAASGDPVGQCEYRVRRLDGSFRWIQDSFRMVRDPFGELVRVVGCSVDVTERVNAQRALRAADRRKDEFLAILSHELRNPLAAIRHAAQVVPAGPAHPALARARGVIERQAVHMARLLDDLLDLSRIANGKLSLQAEPVDLAAIVRDMIEDRTAELLQAGLVVEASVPDGPVWVSGDAVRLAQVVGNLVTNAAKYTDAGGHVHIRVEAGQEALVEVADDGIGIEPELVETLFEPFAQDGASRSRSQGGLGLGLALVRGLVELHGGTVEGQSAGLGRGARFRVRLPAAPAVDVAAVAGTPAVAPLRILVVEDNTDGAEMLRLVLEMSGHTVAVAGDGPSALAQVGAFGPDVVLCDIGLPGELDGFDVARVLRANGPPVRLVALTGRGQPSDVARTRAAGFDHHLTKPVEPVVLERLLAEWPE